MTPADPSNPSPRRRAALAQYRRRAGVYNLELALLEPLRRQAVERLSLRSEQSVIDVGCGTGMSLPLLRQAVGGAGQVIGIEQSPHMLARARRLVLRQGWNNVTLLEAPIESARLSVRCDAALFHFTHDILREPRAVAAMIDSLRPGARVVACGLQWAGPWAWPVNLLVLGAALRSVTALDGLEAPWSLLAGHLETLKIESLMCGGVFMAIGIVRAGPSGA